ncbi:YadA family autotransporter adhesin [Sphingobium aquiterrae]|uniref:YadA family autotransporter adhesin n=1 Tax=Sphingobium aquiterrae TaxID=2038656 RepID=UPI00301AFA2E
MGLRLLAAASILPVLGQVMPARANVVSACSGVSLPKSVLTQAIGDVITPVLNPVESILSALTLGTVNLGISSTLASVASGAPISLNVLDINGNAVNLLTDPVCDTTADSYTLSNPKGISFGGNKITGLGAPGLEASAGEMDAIAIGNLASTSTGAFNAIAIGSGAVATHSGSIALGANSLADGATLGNLGYLVGGTATAELNIGNRRITGVTAGANPTDAVNVQQLTVVNDALADLSDAVVHYDDSTKTIVTLAGAGGTTITNVAAGVNPTDAVNVQQLTDVTNSVDGLSARAVQYDSAAMDVVTLAGASGTRITNVAPGTISATSTDAVNGAQLQATNSIVAQNSTAITQLSYDFAILNALAVKYQDMTKSTVVLEGAGGTTITNVAPGVASNDAVNVAQLSTSGGGTGGGGGGGGTPTSQDALLYDPVKQAYDASRGGVDQHITGVAAGDLSATSSDAVNGAQLYATNVQLAYNTTAITELQNGTAGYFQVNNSAGYATPKATGADSLAGGAGAVASGTRSTAIGTNAQALADNSIAIGYGSVADRAGTVSVGSLGAERQIAYVADGVSATDAVNLRQLQSGMSQATADANAYTDLRFSQFDSGLRDLRADAEGGTAAAMAMSGIPQSTEPGSGMFGMGVSTWQGEHAVAMGVSKASDNGRLVIRAAATYNSRNQGGANAGFGVAF